MPTWKQPTETCQLILRLLTLASIKDGHIFKNIAEILYVYGVESETGADIMETKVNSLEMLEIEITYG